MNYMGEMAVVEFPPRCIPPVLPFVDATVLDEMPFPHRHRRRTYLAPQGWCPIIPAPHQVEEKEEVVGVHEPGHGRVPPRLDGHRWSLPPPPPPISVHPPHQPVFTSEVVVVA